MIVFSAFTPHTPLLLPTISKENAGKLSRTTEAMATLRQKLAQANPEVIVIISTHAVRHETAFSVNLHDEYYVDLKHYGDLVTNKTFSPDLALIDALQRTLRKESVPLTLDSDARLDHGAAVPLTLLAEGLSDIRIIPISYSGLGAKEHVQFGRALKDVLVATSKRIAVIASGDLSHALTSLAPAGFKPEGEQFDEAVRKSIEQMSLVQLLNISETVVASASECAYRPLLMLFGILEGTPVTPEILSYESPFGVGYLVTHFQFS